MIKAKAAKKMVDEYNYNLVQESVERTKRWLNDFCEKTIIHAASAGKLSVTIPCPEDINVGYLHDILKADGYKASISDGKIEISWEES